MFQCLGCLVLLHDFSLYVVRVCSISCCRNEFQAEKNTLNEEKLATQQKMQRGFDAEKSAMQTESQSKVFSSCFAWGAVRVLRLRV